MFDLEKIRTASRKGQFWSSLDELLEEKNFQRILSDEFPWIAPILNQVERRQLLKFMAASLLLSTVGGCSDDRRSTRARPYVEQPEGMTPAVAQYFSTAILVEGYAQPVVAKTYDGRPIKLDGNPDHPVTRGKSDVFVQSSLFSLYDPGRSQSPFFRGEPSTWPAFTTEVKRLRDRWRTTQGAGLYILAGDTTSITLERQFKALLSQFPKAGLHRFEPAGEAQDLSSVVFSRSLEQHLRLDQCETVVSLGSDILGAGARQIFHARSWAEKRGQTDQSRLRLYVAEAIPTITGAVSTKRLPCDISRLPLLAEALAKNLGLGQSAPDLADRERHWVDQATGALQQANGRSLLVADTQLGARTGSLVAAINDKLGNLGRTVWYSEPIRTSSAWNSFDQLVDALNNNKVETLIILDSNPVYSGAGRNFKELLHHVQNRVHLGLYRDETALECEWHLALSHILESWGDARSVDGTTTIVQPVSPRLYDSRSIHQFIDILSGKFDPQPDQAVRMTWQQNFGENFDQNWHHALVSGFVDNSAAPSVAVKPPPSILPPAAATEREADELDILIRPDSNIWDGRFANVAWLQELPRPLSKVTWTNVIEISPALASQRQIANGDRIEIKVGDNSVKGAAWINPGQAQRTVGLGMGYGRDAGVNDISGAGYNAFELIRSSDAEALRGQLNRIEGQEPIATTQDHHRMDGFELVKEVTDRQPSVASKKEPESIYPPVEKSDHAWGMAIDLDSCIGCNACVMACNSENNVQVVGRDQVNQGREMAWLRVDHYYTGDVEDPRSFFQPVPCMHCERAPCEMGCPVHATVHSPDGINQMVYNRCIGTRTCSSYCPYKVRRFNWFDYRSFQEADQAAKNPDVTVRSRGVMEKCTYCTQRIQSALVQSDIEGRKLRRDEVVTACQQACPTTAIVFGDLNDPDSEVSKLKRSERNYALLEELGTRPRTTYLAKWRDDDEGERS